MVNYNDVDQNLTAVFDALANNHRRAIIHTLAFRPASISQLAQKQGLSLPAIHKHIKVLEQAELVQRKKSGRVNFLALNKATLKLLQGWMNQYHTYWGNQEETLDNYIASIKKVDEQLINK